MPAVETGKCPGGRARKRIMDRRSSIHLASPSEHPSLTMVEGVVERGHGGGGRPRGALSETTRLRTVRRPQRELKRSREPRRSRQIRLPRRRATIARCRNGASLGAVRDDAALPSGEDGERVVPVRIRLDRTDRRARRRHRESHFFAVLCGGRRRGRRVPRRALRDAHRAETLIRRAAGVATLDAARAKRGW